MASAVEIPALRVSHDNLVGLVTPLTPEQVRGRSYASEWSIAQVLSHLGSGAVIGKLNLDASIAGEPAPGREQYEVIWDEWNAKDVDAQVADGLAADAVLVEAYEAVTDAELAGLRLAMGPIELRGAEIARARLAEHAVHTWDVAVALDPAAVLEPSAVELLVDNLAMLVGFTGKPVDGPERIVVATTEPGRRFVLDVTDRVELTPAADAEGPVTVTLTAEQLIRLVYGRLEPTGEGQIDRLRPMFPGF
jgi:uncharacterized protein (TIGR03083 family)